MTVFGIPDIQRLLPHRYPMLLIDRVDELDEEARRIVAVKNVSFNEPVLQGHFPGQPIMPGVLLLEAMAQAGGLMMNHLNDTPGQIGYFLGIDKAKFRRMVVPGDCMRIEVEFKRVRLSMARAHGVITVDGELACEADLMFGGADQAEKKDDGAS